MNAAVVEFDALADAVGASAQNHDLSAVGDRGLVRRVVGRIVVGGRLLYAAHRDSVPALLHAQGFPSLKQVPLVDVQKLCQVFVGEAVLLCLD